jgi:hypothetical protein
MVHEYSTRNCWVFGLRISFGIPNNTTFRKFEWLRSAFSNGPKRVAASHPSIWGCKQIRFSEFVFTRLPNVSQSPRLSKSYDWRQLHRCNIKYQIKSNSFRLRTWIHICPLRSPFSKHTLGGYRQRTTHIVCRGAGGENLARIYMT